MAKTIDLMNKKFNKLTVIKRVENSSSGDAQWLCKCECGNYAIVRSTNLRHGAVKSCGCLRKQNAKKMNYKHGLRNTRLYNIWYGMKSRCYDIKNKRYKNYGGRGIKICNEWKYDFIKFYNWAINNGYKDDLTIDRINVNGNYEPNNCRWITMKEQANNTTRSHYVTHNKETHTIAEWSRILNIKYDTLKSKIKKGEF